MRLSYDILKKKDLEKIQQFSTGFNYESEEKVFQFYEHNNLICVIKGHTSNDAFIVNDFILLEQSELTLKNVFMCLFFNDFKLNKISGFIRPSRNLYFLFRINDFKLFVSDEDFLEIEENNQSIPFEVNKLKLLSSERFRVYNYINSKSYFFATCYIDELEKYINLVKNIEKENSNNDISSQSFVKIFPLTKSQKFYI